MSNLPIYEMLAQAFASEGVDSLFNLMGDGLRDALDPRRSNA